MQENVSEICHVWYIEAEVDRKGDTSYGVANDRLLTLRMASRLNDLKKKTVAGLNTLKKGAISDMVAFKLVIMQP
jgi:hypothetical protein